MVPESAFMPMSSLMSRPPKPIAPRMTSFVTMAEVLAGAEGSMAENSTPKRTLLIVEDDAALAAMVAEYLGTAGYAVTHASTGAEGLRQAAAGTFDLVILDVYLPVQDGLETILRVHSQQIPVKVLAISGQAVQGYDILKIAAIFGAHGTLEKPFSVDRLLLGVRALIGPAQHRVA